jgi:Tol biopolymer transport system component
MWSPSGDKLVFRLTTELGQHLLLIDISSGQEQPLASSEGASLFPVGFSPGGNILFYVSLDAGGSDLYALEISSAEATLTARLADGLTRDWKLSPSKDRLAYLVMNLDEGRFASTAFLLDLASGHIAAVGAGSDAFSPTWDRSGGLALGTLAQNESGKSGITRIFNDGQSRFTDSMQGFDVPLGFDSGGELLAVRSFDGATTFAPGRERLEVLTFDGTRRTITTAEVTFLGWIEP